MAAPQKDEKTGVYYFRKGVPLALREAVGLTELRKSLGTKDPVEAKRRHAEMAVEVDAEWARLRRIVAEQQAADAIARPPLVLVSLNHMEAHALAGEIYREQVAKHKSDPGTAAQWDESLATIYQALPLSKRPEEARTPIWNYGMTPGLAAIRQFSGIVQDFLERRRIALDTKSFRLVCSAVALAMRDAALQLRRNAEGDYSPDPAASRFPSAEGVLAKALAPRGPALTVEDLLARWLKSTHVSDATKQSWVGKMRNLARFAGKEDMADITQMDVAEWRDHRKESGISPRTISEGDLAGTHAIFAWAVGEAKLPTITTNPVSGVTIEFQAPPRLRDSGFDLDEAELILRAAMEPAEGFTQAGGGARRWVPWLCAFTGARVGEIAQVHSRNAFVKTTRNGLKIWCLRITPEDGSVKTNVARVIPIHPQVIEQGFPEYVRLRQGKPLFYEPDLARKVGTHHRQSDKVGERLAGWVRDLGIPAPVQPNHAWRHRFESLGRGLAIRKDIVDHITGHGASDVAAEYGEYWTEALYRAICMFPRYLEERQALPPSDHSAGGISILAGPKA